MRRIIPNKLTARLKKQTQVKLAEAHCDGPCGVYDPSSTGIPTEAIGIHKSITGEKVEFTGAGN